MVFNKTVGRFAPISMCLLLIPALAIAVPAKDPAADRFYTANELYNRKLYVVAVKEYQAFLAKHPAHPKAEEARLGLALSLYAMRNYKDTEPALNALIQKGTAGDKNQLGLLRGQCLLKFGLGLFNGQLKGALINPEQQVSLCDGLVVMDG